jgi:hypothetical protein
MYIDEWFETDFYKKLPLGYHQHFSFGQFFRTHAYYPHENLELWRPVPDPDEPTKTIASQFQIVPAGADAFRRGIPLGSPKLETNEEFLVVRASILRLDELQSVFTGNLEPSQFALGDEPASILRGQIQYLITKTGPSSYTELRELLLNS